MASESLQELPMQPDADADAAPRRGPLFRLTNAVDTFMRRFFYRLGYFVASNPLRVVLVSVVVMAVTLAGMLRFRSESRAEELWVPQNTVALSNQDYVNGLYGRFNRLAAVALTSRDTNAGLANRASLLELADLLDQGFDITAGPLSVEGATNTLITWQQRCINTTDAEGTSFCRTDSALTLFYDVSFKKESAPVNFFDVVRAKLATLSDADIKRTMADPPPTAFDGSPFNAAELYAGTSGSGASFDVKVLSSYQYIRNNAIVKDGELIDPEADALEENWSKFVLDTAPNTVLSRTTAFVDTSFSQDESLGEALSGDLPLLAFGFILLAVYVVLFLGDFHAVRSHMWLALGALLTTGLALGSCFGVSSALGMFFGPVHQILPLLIVGIGIDDCFHITRAADDIAARADAGDKPLPARIALALSTAGSAITVTSFTNVVVFLLSAISRLPALRFFSLWAAIGIFFAWVYAVTFYTALVALDMRRVDAGRRDCCPCLKVAEVRELNWFKRERGGFSRFFANQFGPFIMRTPVRIVLVILFAAGFGASVYGCSQLYLKFRFSFFYPAGSAQREYQDVVDEYYKLGALTNVFLRERGLRNETNRALLLDLCDPATGAMARDRWVQNNTVDCWYFNFRQFNNVTEGTFLPEAEFIAAARNYVDESSPGARYARDVVFNDENSDIVSTRFALQYVYRASNDDEIDSLESLRAAADSVGFGTASDGNAAAFPYTFFDTFSEQYAALPGEIGVSLGLACVAVGVVCLVLIGHPLVAGVSLLVVGMIIIAVLGLTNFADVQLNSVSVITLVLCAGISVDFVVHVARAFLEAVGTRTERAIKSLEVMGPPVFYAGFSTFLAIVILSLAKSYIFQVIFKGFVFLLGMAFLHGLILVPVLLSLVGPRSFYNSEDEKEAAERELEASVSAGRKVMDSDVPVESEADAYRTTVTP